MDADTEIQEGGTAMNSDKGMECCGSCAFFQNDDIAEIAWNAIAMLHFKLIEYQKNDRI